MAETNGSTQNKEDISHNKAMATHSGTLAWKIPRTEEPGGLQSMGSLRVGHTEATQQQQQQAICYRIQSALVLFSLVATGANPLFASS